MNGKKWLQRLAAVSLAALFLSGPIATAQTTPVAIGVSCGDGSC